MNYYDYYHKLYNDQMPTDKRDPKQYPSHCRICKKKHYGFNHQMVINRKRIHVCGGCKNHILKKRESTKRAKYRDNRAKALGPLVGWLHA